MKILVVEDDPNLRRGVVSLIGNGDVKSEEAGNGEEALRAMRSNRYDCVILDLGLPDMSGFDLLEACEADEDIVLPPVIVHTGRELTREEETRLQHYAESIIIKGVKSAQA